MKSLDMHGRCEGTRLTGIHRVENNIRGESMWLFQCDCGNFCEILARHVRSHHTVSCGCHRREIFEKNHKKNSENSTQTREEWMVYMGEEINKSSFALLSLFNPPPVIQGKGKKIRNLDK